MVKKQKCGGLAGQVHVDTLLNSGDEVAGDEIRRNVGSVVAVRKYPPGEGEIVPHPTDWQL